MAIWMSSITTGERRVNCWAMDSHSEPGQRTTLLGWAVVKVSADQEGIGADEDGG